MSEEERKGGRKKWIGVLALAALIPVVAAGLQVDDWSRDLSTNTATTRADHPDETLRPLSESHTRPEIVAAVKAVVSAKPLWDLRGEEDTDTTTTLLLTRTTALFKFVDDVRVRVEDKGDHRLVNVGSESRVGKGDLGQNPRNIRELLAATREELGS